jgi:hypothetical protein
MKMTSCNEKKHYAFDNAPRCGARTKHSHGKPCRSPSVRGKKRCRIHGGSSGSGATSGNTNALKHGLTPEKIKKFRKKVKELLKTTTLKTLAKK